MYRLYRIVLHPDTTVHLLQNNHGPTTGTISTGYKYFAGDIRIHITYCDLHSLD